MGKEIFRYFISLTGTTLNSTFRKTQATHKLTATTKWSYIFNFLKPWKTETTSCIYSTKLVLVNIIVREIFGKEKMGLWDWWEEIIIIFSKRREWIQVDSSFNLLIANFYLFAEMVIQQKYLQLTNRHVLQDDWGYFSYLELFITIWMDRKLRNWNILIFNTRKELYNQVCQIIKWV